jgi:hypothetical protein
MIIREFDIREVELKRLKMMLDIKDVCGRAKISYEAWKTFINHGGRRTRTKTVMKLLNALELPVEDVIIFKDIPPDEPPPGTEG